MIFHSCDYFSFFISVQANINLIAIFMGANIPYIALHHILGLYWFIGGWVFCKI